MTVFGRIRIEGLGNEGPVTHPGAEVLSRRGDDVEPVHRKIRLLQQVRHHETHRLGKGVRMAEPADFSVTLHRDVWSRAGQGNGINGLGQDLDGLQHGRPQDVAVQGRRCEQQVSAISDGPQRIQIMDVATQADDLEIEPLPEPEGCDDSLPVVEVDHQVCRCIFIDRCAGSDQRVSHAEPVEAQQQRGRLKPLINIGGMITAPDDGDVQGGGHLWRSVTAGVVTQPDRRVRSGSLEHIGQSQIQP